MSTIVAAIVLFAMWLGWGWLSWRRVLALARRFDSLSPMPRFFLSAGALLLSGAALIGGWMVVSAISPEGEHFGVGAFSVFLVAGALFVSLQMFGASLMWREGTRVTSRPPPASNSRNDHNRQEGEQE